jgi:hypothetical protein
MLGDRFERQQREPHHKRNENAENLPDNGKSHVGIFEQFSADADANAVSAATMGYSRRPMLGLHSSGA